MDLIEHLESELGLIKSGWNKFPEDNNIWPFQIAEMCEGHFKDISAFTTIGLSKYPLKSITSYQLFYQEIIILTPTFYGARNIPSILYDISQFALKNKRAFLRGEIFDYYSGTVFPDANFVAFYVAPLVCYSENFGTYKDSATGHSIILSWFIPIYEREKQFITLNGWKSFENKIGELHPNFFDFFREPIV